MAILDSKRKETVAGIRRLPTGSFSVDRTGRVISSTVPQGFPRPHLENIAVAVLQTFRSAEETDLPLTEFSVYYSGFKISARELKGGAIVFLSTIPMSK
jgi:hypothetical protein